MPASAPRGRTSDKDFRQAWRRHKGSPAAVARVLGLDLRTVYRRRDKLERDGEHLPTRASHRQKPGSVTTPEPAPEPRAAAMDPATLASVIAAAVAAAMRPPAPERAPSTLPAAARWQTPSPGLPVSDMQGVHGRYAPHVVEPSSDEVATDLVFGDSHIDPRVMEANRRVLVLGALHAGAIKARSVVHVGDFGEWASCCHWVDKATWKARGKPSIAEDMDAVRDVWASFTRALDAAGATKERHVLFGNHEAWIEQHENRTPEEYGRHTGELDRMLKGNKWTPHAYGHYVFVGGIGYVHVPMSIMDRPVGGQTAENTVAMQSVFDVVFGHTHFFNSGRRRKLGPGQVVTALNAGSTMPLGYVGDHAQRTQGSHVDSGVLEVTRRRGRIIGHAFRPTAWLEHAYGERADLFLS
jgi:hypothetical protein